MLAVFLFIISDLSYKSYLFVCFIVPVCITSFILSCLFNLSVLYYKLYLFICYLIVSYYLQVLSYFIVCLSNHLFVLQVLLNLFYLTSFVVSVYLTSLVVSYCILLFTSFILFYCLII